ncbi:hypothetical protein F4821DRAFT_276566 [Hypoxylon rubiginosum]|uniref:Uncharacterized protein n=1 Tax=Hypoxylon rubiginosum TaxID=110542 RepID=A0ACC0D904_9PEZI|nr:hypothetical protein F4821DRAFT_276566 [Hypoxylon rubiginosum]
MVSSETPLTPRTPVRPLGRGRVRALSQHFETLQIEQEMTAKRYRSETVSEAADAKDSNDANVDADSPRKPVYTGEFRVPLAKRLENLKGEGKGQGQPFKLRAPADLPPNPPSTPVAPENHPKWRLEPECPGAPKKPLAMRRLSRSSRAPRDSQEHLFDQNANKPHIALHNKSSIDSVVERRARNNTSPISPSPLRTSFSLPPRPADEDYSEEETY